MLLGTTKQSILVNIHNYDCDDWNTWEQDGINGLCQQVTSHSHSMVQPQLWAHICPLALDLSGYEVWDLWFAVQSSWVLAVQTWIWNKHFSLTHEFTSHDENLNKMLELEVRNGSLTKFMSYVRLHSALSLADSWGESWAPFLPPAPLSGTPIWYYPYISIWRGPAVRRQHLLPLPVPSYLEGLSLGSSHSHTNRI